MAKWGMCDFSELEKLEKEFEKLAKTDVEKFCKDVAKELAARLLSKVIPRTPVGEGTFEIIDGKKYTIKSGGTLRRGWTANTEAEAESGSVPDPTTYADSLKIFKFGNNYIVIVENPVKYASYVEYGHRQEPGRYVPALGKRLKQSWVEGKYMLTISEKELESQLPAILEQKMKKYIAYALFAVLGVMVSSAVFTLGNNNKYRIYNSTVRSDLQCLPSDPGYFADPQ